MRQPMIYTDGMTAKAFGIPSHIDDDPDAWVWIEGKPTTDAEIFYQYIPWVYRAVNLIGGAVGKVPWEIQSQAGTTIDNSGEYENKLGYLPDPEKLLAMVAKALTLYGKAYVLKERNQARVLRLRYLSPASISWKIKVNAAGEQLVHKDTGKPVLLFTRTVNGKPIEYTEDDIIFWWLPDPAVEVGPPEAWPARSALIASDVLYQFDVILAKFFKRGMIKPLIISAEGNPPQEERERIENFMNRLFAGVKNAFQTKVFNSQKLTVQDIGVEFKEISDLDLSEDKRHDIAAGFGIPDAIIFSDSANYATAQVDQRNFYDQTVIPLLQFIFDTLNIQLLNTDKFVTMEETMDMYQADENEMTNSLVSIASALEKPEEFVISASILGFEIPDDTMAMIEKLIQRKEENRQQMAESLAQPVQEEQPEEQPPEGEPEEAAVEKAIAKWERFAIHALKRGKAASIEFKSDDIPAGAYARIRAQLVNAKTIQAVKDVFARELKQDDDLAGELKRANDFLERMLSRG